MLFQKRHQETQVLRLRELAPQTSSRPVTERQKGAPHLPSLIRRQDLLVRVCNVGGFFLGGGHGGFPACGVEGGGRGPVAFGVLRCRGVEIDAAGWGEDVLGPSCGGGVGEVDGGGAVDHFCDHGHAGEKTEGFVLRKLSP